MLNGTEQLVFILIQILMFGTTAALIAFTFDRSLFSLHPLTMAIGFLVFVDEGFFAARFIKVLTLLHLFRFLGSQTARRPIALKIHVFCQSIGLMCALVGAVVIMYHKYEGKDEHLENWHELIGACALTLCSLQAALGLRLNSMAFNRFTIQTLFQLTWLHRNVGTAVLIVSHAALITGMWQSYHFDRALAIRLALGFGVPITAIATLLLRFKESKKVITALGASAPGEFNIASS